MDRSAGSGDMLGGKRRIPSRMRIRGGGVGVGVWGKRRRARERRRARAPAADSGCCCAAASSSCETAAAAAVVVVVGGGGGGSVAPWDLRWGGAVPWCSHARRQAQRAWVSIAWGQSQSRTPLARRGKVASG